MALLVSSDTTSLSYWLNWRFFLCALWVFISFLVAAFLIWKYEFPDPSESDSKSTRREGEWISYGVAAWRPCVKEIHPVWLMIFRIVAFCLILTALVADLVVWGGSLFHYYTQWTITVVTIYFGFGSLLSIYGCFQHHRLYSVYGISKEEGSYVSLVSGEDVKGVGSFADHQGKYHLFQTALSWGQLFQILFQMTAGAVVLTDLIYWCIIYPFLTIKEYEFNFLTVVEHSLNAILLLGDTALNSLKFPCFRIAYFILLTAVYVIFEWIVHASVSLWWPYPFMDLSSSYAPLWYLVVALLHLPCYALCVLIVETKYYVLSKWFPQSFQCCIPNTNITT